jgi:hypothetical protein
MHLLQEGNNRLENITYIFTAPVILPRGDNETHATNLKKNTFREKNDNKINIFIILDTIFRFIKNSFRY